MPDIELMDQPEQPTLTIRTRTPVEKLPMVIGESYHKIMDYLQESGEEPSGAPFTAYYNMDMQDLDVELGFPVAKPIQGKNDIQSSRIPAGKIVACLYKGPYSEMKQTYDAMFQWMVEHGFEATGVAFEYYFTGPEVPEKEQVTRIVFPLK